MKYDPAYCMKMDLPMYTIQHVSTHVAKHNYPTSAKEKHIETCDERVGDQGLHHSVDGKPTLFGNLKMGNGSASLNLSRSVLQELVLV